MSSIVKGIMIIVIGGLILYILNEAFIKKEDTKKVSEDDLNNQLKAVLQTDQAAKLMASAEFQELLLTPEFKTLARSIGKQYIMTLAKSITL